MEEFLTPPDSPDNKPKFSPDSVPKDNKTKKSVKYATLPGSTSAVISNERTNLKFGRIFGSGRKKSSTSSGGEDKSEKSPRKVSTGSGDFKILKKLSTEKLFQRRPSVDAVSLQSSTPSSASSSAAATSGKKSPLKFKIFKKLSFTKKSKNKESGEENIEEDTMDGKNNKSSKKKGGKNKWKKVTPGEGIPGGADSSVYSSTTSIPDTTATSSSTFLEREREVKEREVAPAGGPTIVTSSPTTTTSSSPSPEKSDTNLLSTPAQSQDLESTTDNDENYDTPTGTSPSNSQVMTRPAGSDDELNETLKISGASEISTAGSVKSAGDLKKEILSITTPIVTEAGRKKPESKSNNSSTASSSVEKETLPGSTNSTNTAEASASKTANITNGAPKDVSPYSKMPDKREFLYKILVIGELGAGKTSIIKRYVHQFFSPHYRATIGVDFALKVLTWDPETIIRLQLWDIAGQERFGNMTRVYYKEAVGAFIVFDVTRAATFDAVLKWKQDLDSKVQLPDGSPIPCVLLANKCDQPKEGMANNSSKIDEFIKENNFSAWFETSAKDNINIDDAAKTLVHRILENDKVQANGNSNAGETVFSLNKDKEEAKNGKNCAC